MKTNKKRFDQLTAADAMTRNVLTIKETMPAFEAAELLLAKSISGVPVVDDQNRCVGVFSTVDFARIANSLADSNQLPENCPFQLRHRRSNGTDVTLCSLPHGLCPLQRPDMEEGKTLNTCRFPHEIVVEWQSLQPPLVPTDPVKRWMSAQPMTVPGTASLEDCASRMLKANVHRLIVIDEQNSVIGLLSSMDVLKIVANVSPQHSGKV